MNIDKLIEIKNELKKSFDCKNSELRDIYKTSLHYHKRQQQAIKDGFETDVITSLNFYCEDSNGVKWFNIRASQNLNRLQWFKLLLSNSLFLTYQETKKYI